VSKTTIKLFNNNKNSEFSIDFKKGSKQTNGGEMWRRKLGSPGKVSFV
jgi:hypothetical protein